MPKYGILIVNSFLGYIRRDNVYSHSRSNILFLSDTVP